MKKIPFALLLCITLASCSQPAAPAVDAIADSADEGAATTEPATASPAATPFDDHALTSRNVDAFFAAQPALAAAVAADPALDPAMDMSEEDNDDYVARLENTPALRAAIASTGISVRDYAWTSEHLLGALMAQAALEKNLIKELPEGVSQRNVDFVRTHKASLQARVQALQE